jgi:hypothetical protein
MFSTPRAKEVNGSRFGQWHLVAEFSLILLLAVRQRVG